MPDNLDDTQEPTGTQPVSLPEWKSAPPRTPTPASGHVQQTSQHSSRRKRRRGSQGALYLPAWSVGLMLLLVFGITGAIIMLVITLGGGNQPGGEPQVIIITAGPTDTPEPNQTASVAGVEPLPNLQGPLPTFGLEGPTLEAIPTATATPPDITVGATVIVNTDQLRVRPSPGLDNKELFYAAQGDRFTVVGGPQVASDITWWHIQDENDPTRDGWAAADYLDVDVSGQ